jgi:hypothetical protein
MSITIKNRHFKGEQKCLISQCASLKNAQSELTAFVYRQNQVVTKPGATLKASTKQTQEPVGTNSQWKKIVLKHLNENRINQVFYKIFIQVLHK